MTDAVALFLQHRWRSDYVAQSEGLLSRRINRPIIAPVKYFVPGTTPLTVDVKIGQQTLNIELTD